MHNLFVAICCTCVRVALKYTCFTGGFIVGFVLGGGARWAGGFICCYLSYLRARGLKIFVFCGVLHGALIRGDEFVDSCHT